MTIFLIGFMGSGKTTVGKQLAKMLKLDFYDLDNMIEKKFNKSISRIFEEEGEDEFRKKENQLLLELSAKNNLVLATGGGTPCFYNNIELMNNTGITAYLKISPSVLFSRLNNSKNKIQNHGQKRSEASKSWAEAKRSLKIMGRSEAKPQNYLNVRPLIKDFNENDLKIFIDSTFKAREPFYLKAKFIIDALNFDINTLAETLKQF